MPFEWIERMAELERSRRQDEKILRKAIGEFQRLLTIQIDSDLAHYNSLFPGERIFIEQQNEPGWTVIRRVRDAETIYTGIPREVRFSFVLPMMISRCAFTHKAGRDREFNLVMDETGKLGLAEGSLETLSEYLLAPILFDKLPDGV